MARDCWKECTLLQAGPCLESCGRGVGVGGVYRGRQCISDGWGSYVKRGFSHTFTWNVLQERRKETFSFRLPIDGLAAQQNAGALLSEGRYLKIVIELPACGTRLDNLPGALPKAGNHIFI